MITVNLSIRRVGTSPNAAIIADLDFVREIFLNDLNFYIDISTKQFCQQLISFLVIKSGYEICSLITLLNLDDIFLANNDNEVKKYLIDILNLPFLPPEDIAPQFDDIQNNLSAQSQEATLLFAISFEREWIEGVSPKRFTVYTCLQCVSKMFELYASRLSVLMGS